MPGLREIAAEHLSAIAADPGGLAEDITYSAPDGPDLVMRALWSSEDQQGTRQVTEHVSDFGGARCRIPLADLPVVAPRAKILRHATGETWEIRDHVVSAGVAWLLSLERPGVARVAV